MPRLMKLGDLIRTERVEVPLRADGAEEGWLRLRRRLAEAGSTAVPTIVQDLLVSPRTALQVHEGGSQLGIAVGVSPDPLTGKDGEESGPRILVLVATPPGVGVSTEALEKLRKALAEPETEAALLTASSVEDVLGLSRLMEVELIRKPLVRDAVTPMPYRIYPDTPMAEVIDLMARKSLGAVPVVDRDLQVLGVISSGEALRQTIQTGGGDPGNMSDLAARDVMSRSVLCVGEDDELADAARIMVTRDLSQLPVVRDGEVVGFLTRETVLRSLLGAAS